MENNNLAHLLPVNFEGEKPTVSGRELHAALEIGTEYAKWLERMTEYGFTEGEDYSSILTNRSDGKAGKPKTDHELTIPMAKELCMLQRNEKGKLFRKYFIKIEEMWNSPEMITKRALQIADARIKQLTATVTTLNNDIDCLEGEVNCLNRELKIQNKVIEQAQPKVEFYDTVADSKENISVSKYAKLLCKDGANVGQNRLFKWFRDGGYLRKNNEPYQQYVDAGYFYVLEYTMYIKGVPSVGTKTLITGKGQQYFYKKIMADFANHTLAACR